jgi:hypothetical protein
MMKREHAEFKPRFALPLSYGTLGMPAGIEPATDVVASAFTAEKVLVKKRRGRQGFW